ncbi:MAG TPA: Ig-like domain-containing protein [Gemmatimonadales bacterium]|nr:Ig-like domain-containing protein [Gemmatimonadales bacterium]
MRPFLTTAALLLAGCGGLTATEDGVAFLDVVRPASTTLEVGATVQLTAVARDARGEPVNAIIRWVSGDDFVTVDEVTGVVTGLAEGTGGRIQASTGTGSQAIYSDPLLLTVVAPPPPPPPPPPPAAPR